MSSMIYLHHLQHVLSLDNSTAEKGGGDRGERKRRDKSRKTGKNGRNEIEGGRQEKDGRWDQQDKRNAVGKEEFKGEGKIK